MHMIQMRKTTIPLLVLGILVAQACSQEKRIGSDHANLRFLPPGTLKIGDNLYMDACETRNLDYLEYCHWIRQVYGDTSAEYRQTLPDTSCWKHLGIYYTRFISHYFNNKQYYRYPIVGISFQQAINFSKWRSDRVMEFFLTRERILHYNPKPTKENMFSIERYFSGSYLGIRPDTTFYYPEYTLPDSLQFAQALAYNQNILQQTNHSKENGNCFGNLTDTTDSIPYGTEPTTVCEFYQRRISKNETLKNLSGNVREWTNIDGKALYGSYKDSCTTNNSIGFIFDGLPNAYTGMRNVCVFKKWK